MEIKGKVVFFKPKSLQPITHLSWKQAKVRFPGLNPYKDADKDGLMNYRDCKPFNIKKQGDSHRKRYPDDLAVSFDTIKEFKTVGDVQKLEESILKRDADED